MKKQGISTVLSTVLILALVMVVTAIVWITISNVVKNSSEEISLGKVEVSLDILKVYAEGNNLIVNVERGKGKGDLTGIRFVVRSETEEEIVNKDIELKEFDSEKFSLTLTKFKPLDVVKVSIAPLLESGSADIKDVWEKEGRKVVGCTPECLCSKDTCTGQTCSDSVCGTTCQGTKVPLTCASQGYDCGALADGCGNMINCGKNTEQCVKTFGTCTAYGLQTCVNGKWGECSAVDPRPDNCMGMQCGDDGCGGSCGSCSNGKVCISGICTCVPNCAGKTCGDNGCGGTCAPGCTGNQVCTNGVCICTPNCAGKTCGDNGCGGTCGTCGAGYDCVSGACAQGLRIFVTNSIYTGNLGGVTGADAKCNSDANKPAGTRTWKALIGTTNRQVSGSATDWVLKANTKYYRTDGLLIDLTGPPAWFTFNLDNVINSNSYYTWTGLGSSGLVSSNCNSWTTSTSLTAYRGYTPSSALMSISQAPYACSYTFRLYCVEQPTP